jgi:acetyl esterase/lipase
MHAIAGGSGRPISATRASLVAALLLLGAVLTVASPVGVRAASARYLDPVFSTVRRDADVRYGKVKRSDGTIEPLRLDLYRPAGDTARNRPVVIFVHGGDYTTDKAAWRNRQAGILFAKRGFVAGVIAYRKGTSGASREAAWDLRAAVRWFKRYADSLRVSPNRIVVMGSSAGATAAMHATFNPSDAGTSGNPGYSSTVAGGISLSGSGDPSEINAGDPPIATIVAKDDTAFYGTSIATCNYTRSQGNICDAYEYETGGHPPKFWVDNRFKIVEQSSRFICARALPAKVCGV